MFLLSLLSLLYIICVYIYTYSPFVASRIFYRIDVSPQSATPAPAATALPVRRGGDSRGRSTRRRTSAPTALWRLDAADLIPKDNYRPLITIVLQNL